MADVNLNQLPANGNPRVVVDSVDDTETSDVFSFSLGSTSNLNLALTGLDSVSDADLRLYEDSNSNGEIDASDTVIANSARGNGLDDSINSADLAAGDYLAEVYQFSGNTEYSLALSTSDPSNLLPNEVEVGELSSQGDYFGSGSISNSNTADVYHFSLDTDSDFSLELSGLSSDADVRLIQDINNNGRIGSNEVIATSSFGGSFTDSIDRSLEAGDYFVQVYQYSGNTNYDLSMAVV